MPNLKKGDKKLINAWAVYDLANSVYNLVITATIFPIYYKLVTTTKGANGTEVSNVQFFGNEIKNTSLYDFAIAFAFLLVAVIVPFLSGIADYGGNKKRFMQFFSYLGAISCSLMYFFNENTLSLGIILAVLACVGYAGSLVFYNSYLPEIAEDHQQDAVSAKGFAMGYIGSAVLLIVNLIMVMTRETGEEKMQMMRWSFVTVGIWWFSFAQITFYFLPNPKNKPKDKESNIFKGYRELKKVWGELKHNKRLVRFLPAFFIYSMGVQTIMLIANHFGSDEIKMEAGQLITTILIIQFVAMLGAYLFSFVSRKTNNLFTLKIATVIWSLICICTYFFVFTAFHFYIVAAFVGLVMGGIQSLSRSTYSKMLPETEDHASYFSFYDVCEKMSIVLGMATFGIINEISPTMRTPIVALIAFFVFGYLLLLRVPNLKEDK
ncbi:MAG: MFS transporter permease [Bacteroidetes bacterium RIFCSPLOWO2_12_FULL_35_15]|nr:MAG: MFS transporter permease [Bacteroidetes bacterium RIFCSPLOWO2_12_FULL_35_15]